MNSKQLHKIRIVQNGGGTITWGVTIPVAFDKWRGIYVSIEQSGTSLILSSGALPVSFTLKEIKGLSTIVDRVNI